MDVDPITDDECIATLGYEALVGSEFEEQHGWHVNLMPKSVLRELPDGWESRACEEAYGNLTVIVPSADDLLVPKLARGEPRDLKHVRYAQEMGMVAKPSLTGEPTAPSQSQK